MKNRIRTVIIGMGRMGRTRYEAMKKQGGYEILALCDTNPDNLIDYPEEKFTKWETCLEMPGIDAVIVCTYTGNIVNIVCKALEMGFHVFSEKPPGKNITETLAMKEALSKCKKGAILKFGFNHRYHNSVIEAKSLLDSGIMGDVVCARGVYGKAGNPNFTNEWRNDPGISGGGILIDQGIHMIDLLVYFLGDFKEVLCTVDNLVWKDMTTEDSVFAIMKTEKGQTASLHSNALQWKHKFDLDIICTNGYIALNGLLTSTLSYGEECITYYRKDLEQRTGRLGKPKEYTMCFDTDESWNIEMKEFYEAITGNCTLTNGSIEDAVRVMSLIDNIYHQKQLLSQRGEDR